MPISKFFLRALRELRGDMKKTCVHPCHCPDKSGQAPAISWFLCVLSALSSAQIPGTGWAVIIFNKIRYRDIGCRRS